MTQPARETSEVRIYTRDEFAKRVGTSTWVLRKLNANGVFRAFVSPERGGRGKRALYTEDQIEQFRRLPPVSPSEFDANYGGLYTPAQAQQVFAAFEEGRSRRWVVASLGVLPEAVSILWERYQNLELGVVMTKPTLDRVAEIEALEGPSVVRTAADLFAVLEATAARVEKLTQKNEELEEQLAEAHACATPSCKRVAFYCAPCVASTLEEARRLARAEGRQEGMRELADRLGIDLDAMLASAQKQTGGAPEEGAPPAGGHASSEATTPSRPAARARAGRSASPPRSPRRPTPG